MVKTIEILILLYLLLSAAAVCTNAVPWAPRGGEVERRRRTSTVVWWSMFVDSVCLGIAIALLVESLAPESSYLGAALFLVGFAIMIGIPCLGVRVANRLLRRFPLNEDLNAATFKIE